MKSRKNNKGFTMVELLMTVVILGILSVTAITAVSRLITKSKTEQKENQEKTMEIAARSYLQSNTDMMPKAIGESRTIKARDLKNANFLKEDLKDSAGEDCMEKSYVKVYKTSKADYTYTAYLYCGNEEVVDDSTDINPTITIEFRGKRDAKGNIQNVSSAILAIKIEGGKKGSQNVSLEGYSFSLSVKTKEDTNLREVYNSGTLNANNKNVIVIEKPITDYIDITDLSYVKAKVVARNSEGGYTEEEDSATGTEGAIDSLLDETNPICVKEGKLFKGEAEEGNWARSRTITVNCDDGEGSKCVRDTFTRTWPNEQQQEAEYAYIQVKDNAGNKSVEDKFITQNDPCNEIADLSNKCRVRVNVDVTYPTFTVEAYKRNTSGNKANSTNLIASNTIKKNDNAVSTYTIESDSYSDAIKGSNYWFNSSYANGVVYEITLKDNLHLASWKWETNLPYITNTKDTNYNKYRTGTDIDENKRATIKDPDMTKNNCGKRTEVIKIFFVHEGLRRGRLTVTDKAGNTTYLYISAKIDRTAPPVPTVKFFKYNEKGTSVTKTEYTPNKSTWSNRSIQGKGYHSGDKKANGGNKNLTEDLSGFLKYKRKGKNAKGNDITEADGAAFDFKGDNYEGKNTIQFCACDKAGNCSNYTSVYNVWVDTKAPTASVTAHVGSISGTKVLDAVVANNGNKSRSIAHTAYSKLSGGWMNNSNFPNGVAYKFSISDNVGIKSYNWSTGVSGENNSDNSLGKKSDTIAGILMKEGKRKGTFTLTDEAGNKVTVTIEAWLDRTKPTGFGISNSSGGKWTNKNVTISMSAKDSLAGIGAYQYSYNNKSWSNYSNSGSNSFKASFTSEQNHGVYFRSCDKAGNCTGSKSTWIKIDKTRPNAWTTHPGISNSATGHCSDSLSGIRSGGGTRSIGWGSSGTLYFSCTDNAGNTSSTSRYMGYSTCAAGHNTCKYGCDTCGGQPYDCSYYDNCARTEYYNCQYSNPTASGTGKCYYPKVSRGCLASGVCNCCNYRCKPVRYKRTCHRPKYKCRCSNCKTGENTCQKGYR